jgi:hypothetical protein
VFGTICPTCYGWLSPSCVLCGGSPDPGVTVEALARGVHRVDMATGGTLGSAGILDLLRRP